MLAPFLIMLREGLEAALIVGIIAGYLRQTGRREWLPAIWVGVFLAVAMSLFAGAAIQLVSAGFPQKMQELFEALIGLVAVAVLVGMVFWMRRAARSIRAELHANIDEALAYKGSAGTWALIGIVFLAVAREGLESVFFLLAIFQQSQDSAAPIGALLGLIGAVGAGWGIYAGALRLDLRRFFRWTGVLSCWWRRGCWPVRSGHCTRRGCGTACKAGSLTSAGPCRNPARWAPCCLVFWAIAKPPRWARRWSGTSSWR